MLCHVCVFCGSSCGASPIYAETAAHLGRLLAARDIGLVFGGSRLGLMGVLADACLAAGGSVSGVIPQALVAKEIAHEGLTELRVVTSMHERKAVMADKADAFLALPGGYGTWEEFCEALTWSQLGLHRKPCGLLNVNSYYDPLLAMADRAASEGFLRKEYREMLIADDDPSRLLDRLSEYAIPSVEKWLDRETL